MPELTPSQTRLLVFLNNTREWSTTISELTLCRLLEPQDIDAVDSLVDLGLVRRNSMSWEPAVALAAAGTMIVQQLIALPAYNPMAHWTMDDLHRTYDLYRKHARREAEALIATERRLADIRAEIRRRGP